MKNNKTLPTLIILLTVLIFVYLGISMWEAGSVSDAYVASTTKTAKVYKLSGSGALEDAGELARGVQVQKRLKTINMATPDADEKRILAYIKTDDGDELYILEENLVDEFVDCVQEKEMYVRTPVTVYSDEEDSKIESYAPKGTKMDIVGFSYIKDDGEVHRYQVKFEDMKGEETTGWVYAKYLVADEEAALANYNENGEYDNAKKAVYGMNLYGGKAENLDFYPYEKTEFEDDSVLADARAMYLNTAAAMNYKTYIKFIKTTGCNAVVIDIKDGMLAYKSEVAKEYSPTSYKKAYTSQEKFEEAIQAYREAGLYVIGRIVVFNDPQYAKDHPENCIEYNGNSSWPSAFSRDVWEYNVKLAQETAKLGLDEVQFDYVRFPEASYEMSKSGNANFRNKYKEEKGQAIQNFCFYAADNLREVGCYISVDVFGESAYGYVTAYGQYWPAISNIVDVISAMPYTDHFAGEEPWANPYNSVKRWAKRAAKQQKMIQNPAIARTWITGYDTPYWKPTVVYGEKELKQQINALKNAGLESGFIPWNVLSSLDKYKSYKAIWDAK